MAGGLMQISTYGSQDLFLTGTPEITFFKVVYRRHTIFAMESVRVDFSDPVNFGSTNTAIIPKIGDLIQRTYVYVQLPEMNLLRQNLPDPTDAELRYRNTRNQYFNTVQPFMGVNRSAFVAAEDIYAAENTVNATEEMILAINAIFNAPANRRRAEAFQSLVNTTNTAPFTYDEVSMQSIANTFTSESDKTALFNALLIGIDKTIKTQLFFFNRYLAARVNLEDTTNPNIRFAWVNRVGHAVMDVIEVRIGGQKIDRHYGDWLNIWYELKGDRSMQEAYYKMIGEVPELTTFDRTIKPTYTLKIPLQFWFCRYSGLAIPLVSLEYHDVAIRVTFRNIQELCFTEQDTIKYSQSETGITLAEVPADLGNNIDAFLMIDFIYLDSPERRRFAQSSHEYLIDELQMLEQRNINQFQIQLVINNFVHPSKEIIWRAQRSSFLTNFSGFSKCRWDNYSVNATGIGNPISTSSLAFNSYSRVIQLDGNYFNYVQPYECHWATPSDGINMYSFSLFPEESQPSGTANFSRISRIALSLTFDPAILDNPNPRLIVRVYTRNTNILRFVSGLSALAYTYG